jgi:hypothetical protein
MEKDKYKVPICAYYLQRFAAHGLVKWMPDKMYIKLIYQFSMKKKLNLKNPLTYTEKLQWIKLFDRREEYTNMVDKYEVRHFVSQAIGEEYLIPLLGVWDKPEDIDFSKLPNQFVLKCNHDSGGIVICKDKSKLDYQKTVAFLNKRLKRNFFWMAREWPYKNVKKKVIAEKYMVDERENELKDYKFFCFNGVCRAAYIATDRGIDTRFDFFDRDFNHLPIINGHDNADKPILKPDSWELMIELAEKLSVGIPQVRVDLYDVLGHVYFGEMTLFHWGGKKPFEPEEWDYTFGSWIELPTRHN